MTESLMVSFAETGSAICGRRLQTATWALKLAAVAVWRRLPQNKGYAFWILKVITNIVV